MRILHVIPSIVPESGGPSKAVVDFANLLVKGHQVSIVCTHEGFSSKKTDGLHKLIGLDEEVNLKMFSYKGTHSSKFSVFLLRWFKHELINFDVVHIHAAFSVMSSLAAKECRRQGIPFVFRPLGTLSPFSMNSGNAQFKNWYWKYVESKNCNGARYIHVTSEKEKEDIIKIGLKSDIVVSPLPVVSEHDKPRSKRHKPVSLGVLTRIHPKKNLETILFAAEKLAETYDFEIEIAGTGDLDYTGMLQSIAESKSLAGKVNFSGFLQGSEKKAFWNRTDYFILPSHHENFGRSVAEAMANGIPVIISDQIDLAPYVKLHGCGIVSDISLSQFTGAMEKALKMTDDEYQQVSANALECVKKEFDPEVVTKQLLSMYQFEL